MLTVSRPGGNLSRMLRRNGVASHAACAALLLCIASAAHGAARTKSGSKSPELTPGAHSVMIAGARIAQLPRGGE